MNKLFYLIVFIGAVAIWPSALHAQDLETDTVQFQTSAYTDLQDTSTVNVEGKFIWYGRDHINWIQEGGSVVYSMEVINSSTSSLPVEVGETLTTAVSLDGGITGSFELTKLESGIAITLSLIGGTTPIHLRYSVSSIDIL